MLRDLFLLIIIMTLLTTIAIADTKSHMDIGMGLFNQGSYSDALGEFEVAFNESPDSVDAHFYYALALYYCDKLEQSRAEFRKIAKKEKDSPWGKASLQFIEAIDLNITAPEKEDDFDGVFILSYDSDDNITYNPSLVAEGGDTKTSAQMNITYKPVLLSYRPISFSLNPYAINYYRNPNYNMYGGSGDIVIYSPNFNGTYASLSYGSGTYYQKYDKYYLTDYIEARYNLNLIGLPGTWTTVYTGGTNNVYQMASYEAYDSYDSKVGIRQNLNLLMHVQYEGKFSRTRSDDYANHSNEFEIGAYAPFPYFHKLFITGKYINKQFLYDDSIGKDLRQDSSYIFDMYFSKEYIDSVTLGLRYTFTNYTSNLDKTQTALGYGSYQDRILSLSISYDF